MHHGVSLKRLGTMVTAAVALGASAQSLAQPKIEEVIVTAQFRSESMQDVPISITAFSDSAMTDRGMQNTLDLNENLPNINVAKNTGLSTGMKVYIRGVGEDESRLGADPAVGIYVDDVYLGRQTGALMNLANIESMEVLRGPQGTLYGRNSNGGAVRITTVKPSLENSFTLKGLVGNYDRRQTSMRLNGALGEKVAGQLTVMDDRSEGFITNTTKNKSLGDVNMQAYRVALRYLGDNWDVLWTADHTDDDSDPGIASFTRSADIDGDLFTVADSQYSLDSDEFFNETTQSGTSLRINGAIGDIELTSITAYRELENSFKTIIGLPYFQDLDQDQVSQELRLSGSTDSIDWVGGLYLYREQGDQYTEFVRGSAMIDQTTESVAIFGQGTYHWGDDWHFTAGLRYTDESKDFEGFVSPDYFNTTAIERQGEQTQDWSQVSWKLVAAYDFNEVSMAYASITNGFKSGGWSSDSFLPVDEETVNTYEFGLKSDPLENLRVNGAIFYNDYDDLQLNGTVPEGGFSRYNAGTVITYGAELDVTWQVTEELKLDAFVGTLEGEYDELTETALDVIDYSKELKQAPEITYGINANYVKMLAAGELVTNVQYTHTAEQYNNVANTPALLRDATDMVNARIALNIDRDGLQYSVGLWGRNLTDEEYYAAGTSGIFVYPGDPRTYGIDFKLSF